MSWSLAVPRGDWVSDYPSTNGKIILGMRLAWVFVAFDLSLVVAILVLAKQGQLPKDTPWDVITTILELSGWFIAGLMGLGIAQFVGKRATTDAVVVKAVSDAKIAEANTPGTVTTTSTVTATPGVLTQADAQTAAETLEARQREIAAASADGAVG